MLTIRSRLMPLSVAVSLLVALLLIPGLVRPGAAACSSDGAASVVTDQIDYGPGDLVTITGSGLPCAATLAVKVTAPTGIVTTASVTTDNAGQFTTAYRIPLQNFDGKYAMHVLDVNASMRAGESRLVLAEGIFYDSHFRFSHLSYSATGPNSVNFTLKSAFRRGGYTCVNAPSTASKPCTGPGGFAGVGDYVLESIGGTSLLFGDAQSTPALIYQVDAIDVAGDWLQANALQPNTVNRVIPHTYAGPGPITASVDSCCRTSLEINNPGADYRIQTIVNLTGGHTASPVSSLPAIVDCPLSALCTFTVPAVQANGNAIRFRLSTSLEAGGTFLQPGPPQAPSAASINATTGLYSWNTTGSLGGAGSLYSTQVTIEDLSPAGAVLSKSAVDFLIRKVSGVPPVFNVPPTPASGSTITVTAGSAVTFPVQASVAVVGHTVSVSHLGLPAGATLTCPPPANPTLCAFSWTPTIAQLGSHLLTFTAQDVQSGLNASPHQITILVIAPVGGSLDLSINNSGVGAASAEVADAPELNVTGDWTVEAWFKDESPAGYSHDFAEIITKGDRAFDGEQPYLITIGFDTLIAGLRTDFVDYAVSYDLSLNAVSANAWHHVAASFNATTTVLTLYLDGIQVAQDTLTATSTGNSAPVSIGNDATAGKYWPGKLDDVRLWNRVRTGTEISGSYLNEFASPQPTLVGNWRFNEPRGSGTTSADNAAPPHNATLMGGADFSCDTHSTPTCTP